MTLRYEASAKAAIALGVTVQPLGVGGPNDFDDAFPAMNCEPPDAILIDLMAREQYQAAFAACWSVRPPPTAPKRRGWRTVLPPALG